jgi:IPT/TIG domain
MTRLRRDRRHPRLAGAIFTGALVAFQAIGLVGAQTASAAVFTGGFSPKIFSGGADLNGDGVVTGRDDSQDFFGETDIIDGKLDCNAWGTAAGDENDGTAGDLVINASDDCSLVAYDGTSDGVTITVTDGAFGWPIGTALPTVYNAANPDSPGVHAADFAWSTILGKVDSNGNEVIDDDDCTFGLIGQTVDVGLGDPTDGADILGSDPLCGFAVAPASTLDGLVDLNSDVAITSADTCTNGCFFGHNVTLGLVQVEGSTSAPTITSFSPTSGPVGATVTINGTNFTGATSVKFNGVSATFIVNSATKITATVPTGATTGRISVTTPGGTATST